MIYSAKMQPFKNKNIIKKSQQIMKDLFYHSQIRKFQSENLLHQKKVNEENQEQSALEKQQNKNNNKKNMFKTQTKINASLVDGLNNRFSYKIIPPQIYKKENNNQKVSLKNQNITSKNNYEHDKSAQILPIPINDLQKLNSSSTQLVKNLKKMSNISNSSRISQRISNKNQMKSFIKCQKEQEEKLNKTKNKTRELHKQIKDLEKIVYKQRENLIVQRLKFIKQRENVDQRMQFFQKQQFQLQQKISELQAKNHLFELGKKQNQQKIRRREIQIRNITYEFQCLNLNHEQKVQKYQKQLQNQKKINSKLCKKIYTNKLQLVNRVDKNKKLFEFNKKNKELLRRLIRKQEENNKLKLEKLILEQKQKEQLKIQICQLISKEKEGMFHKLDSVLNLIRQHMKISVNHFQFKRIIRQHGMNYQKELRQIQTNQLTKQMMALYQNKLWTASLKTINNENIPEQPEQLALLKKNGKQLQLKKQELNQQMNTKKEQIEALQLKKQKIQSQIQKHNDKKYKKGIKSQDQSDQNQI